MDFSVRPLPLAQWVVDTLQYHITMRDILAMPQDTSINLFCMDRSISRSRGGQPPKKPSIYFKDAHYVTFTKIGGIRGKWLFNSNPRTTYLQEFYVYIQETDEWAMLRDDRIFHSKEKKYVGRHYTEFPEDTRIGWRGPMMLRKNMDRCPPII